MARFIELTTVQVNVNLAFKNLEEIFVLNQYPKKLIKNKINEIKVRDFGPNSNKELRLPDENNQELTFFTLVSRILVLDVAKLQLT